MKRQSIGAAIAGATASLLLSACPVETSPDSGALDAGEVISDAGQPSDGGVQTDAGEIDAGDVDAGDRPPVDGGLTDGGLLDGGLLDGGPTDSGTTDAGPLDAGATDGGTPAPRCAALDFSTGHVVVEGTEGDNLEAGFTVETWVRLEAASNNVDTILFGKHDCGVNNGFFLSLENNRAAFYVETNPRLIDSATINDGEWHHLAGVFDGATSTLFVDGVAVASQSRTYATVNASPWTMGDCSAGGPAIALDGLIDVVRLSTGARYGSDFTPDGLLRSDSATLGVWQFEEGSGAIAVDGSGNGNDGTIVGATRVFECADIDDCAANACLNGGVCVDGLQSFTCDCAGTSYVGDLCEVERQCGSIDLSGGSVSIPNTEDLHLTSGFTIEAWLHLTDASNNIDTILFGKHACGTNNGFFLSLENNRAAFYVETNPRLIDGALLNDNGWHHVAGVFDGSTSTLFVDGVPTQTQTRTYATVNAGAWTIGGCSLGETLAGLDGVVDELRLSSSARYTAQFDPALTLNADTDALAVWHFDDAANANLAADESGNGYDGTVTGATWTEMCLPFD